MDYNKAFKLDSYMQPPATFPGWPKAGTGHWELRDFYLLNLEWLTSHGAYCYSQRVFYEDAEWQASEPLESYDRSGRFWKVLWEALAPINFRGQQTMIEIASIGTVSARGLSKLAYNRDGRISDHYRRGRRRHRSGAGSPAIQGCERHHHPRQPLAHHEVATTLTASQRRM